MQIVPSDALKGICELCGKVIYATSYIAHGDKGKNILDCDISISDKLKAPTKTNHGWGVVHKYYCKSDKSLLRFKARSQTP